MTTIDPREEHRTLLRTQIEAVGKTDEVAPQLVDLAVETWMVWQEAASLIRAEGVVLKTNAGAMPHPAAQIARQSCQSYTALLGRMGISASPSQARYKANKPTRLAPVESIAELMARQPGRVARPS